MYVVQRVLSSRLTAGVGSLIAALVFIGVSSMATADSAGYPASDYKKMEVYYHFGYESQHKVSLDRAREVSETKIVSLDTRYIAGFVQWLRLSEMEPVDTVDQNKTGAFIVIDLYRRDDGVKETFFSDGDYLYSLAPSMQRVVDIEFRSKFHFFEDVDPLGLTSN